jgi:hypothetical protein
MFLVLYTWLAMHASARASSGATHLLTRSVRLPIPTPKQLDRARMSGNTFEKQRMHEVFRVPFVAPAPHGPDVADEAPPNSKGGTRRMPRWYQVDELEETGAKGSDSSSITPVPDHFELYRELQTEWVGHDVYARIGMLYYMSHWIAAIPLYSQCHVFGELRALWPAWTVSLIFAVAHFAILKLDIVPQESREFSLLGGLPMENIVPIIPLITVLGMSLDYSIIAPSTGWKAIIYVLSWICYIIQFLWALRIFDISRPAESAVPAMDQPGLPQYPPEWKLPPALAGACYIVAPPTKLEGFSCIQQEMKSAKGGVSSAPPRTRKMKTPPTFFAWKLLRGGVLVMISIWTFLMIARIIEQVNGERMTLKQEGRIERWPSHMQPWMPPWTRKGSKQEWAHTGGADRRLQEMERPTPRALQVQEAAQRLASMLGPVAQALEAEMQTTPAESTTASPAVEMHTAGVNLPPGLEPALLASGGSSGKHLAVLPRNAQLKGALMHLAALEEEGNLDSATEPRAPVSFELQGLEGLGDLMGASWGNTGLLLTTSTGALAECGGFPAEGIWPCTTLDVTLPMGGSSLAAATVAWIPGTSSLRAAVRFAEDEGVTLLDMSHRDSGIWLPAGEVKLPEAAGATFSLSTGADELVLSTNRGGVLSWPVGGSRPVLAATPRKASGIDQDMISHAACSCGKGRFAQLASPREGHPQLLFSPLV